MEKKPGKKLGAAVEGVTRVMDRTADGGYMEEEVEFCREVSYALYWICRNLAPAGFEKDAGSKEQAMHAAQRALEALTEACKAYEKDVFMNRAGAIREGMRCMEVFHRAKEAYLSGVKDHSEREASDS